MDDAALVRRLAIEKLEAKAAELRPGWAWAKAALDLEYGALAQYSRVRPQPAQVPAELAEEIERIEQRLGELEEIDPGGFTDDLAAEAERLEERRAEIDEIVEGLAVYSDEDRARAGVIVTIGEHGEFRMLEGLIERSTVRGEEPRHDAGDGNGSDDEAWSPTEGEDDDAYAEPSAPRVSPEQALRKQCGFSQLLVDDLKAHRHQITRAFLAGNFDVAFDLALYSLCAEIFDRYRFRPNPLDLRAIESAPRSSLNDLADTAADRLIEAHRGRLDLDWLTLPPAQSFAALAALSPAAKHCLFAWCIAACVKPQLAIEDRADQAIEEAGQRLAIPFGDLRRPTAANYWGRVKKAHGLAVAGEILGPRWARDHADDKKVVLAAALETAFDAQKNAACISLDQASRDAAVAWLPPGMAYDGAPADARPDDVDDAAPDNAVANGIDPAAAELPAFLTADEPSALDAATAA